MHDNRNAVCFSIILSIMYSRICRFNQLLRSECICLLLTHAIVGENISIPRKDAREISKYLNQKLSASYRGTVVADPNQLLEMDANSMENRLTPEQKLILQRARERLPSPPPLPMPEGFVLPPIRDDRPPLPPMSFEEFIRRRERSILNYNRRRQQIEERFRRQMNRIDQHIEDYQTYIHEKRIDYLENRNRDQDRL